VQLPGCPSQLSGFAGRWKSAELVGHVTGVEPTSDEIVMERVFQASGPALQVGAAGLAGALTLTVLIVAV